MNYIGEIISGVFALLVVWLQVRMTRDRKQTEKRAAIRAKESKLAMKMQDASLSLSLATCIAVERGETNGEMKTARDKAKTAQEEYRRIEHIQVPEPNRFIIIFYNGDSIECDWAHRSRSESWTDEMKQAARERDQKRRQEQTCQQ